MNFANKLAIVNSEIGNFLIGIFFVVCVALVLIIFTMMRDEDSKH